jgi:hypothetical protein
MTGTPARRWSASVIRAPMSGAMTAGSRVRAFRVCQGKRVRIRAENPPSERPGIRDKPPPGMPAGPPGASGTKTAPFTVYELSEDAKVFAVEERGRRLSVQ